VFRGFWRGLKANSFVWDAGIVICCSTKTLVSLNVRLNEALTAVYKLSNDVIQQLLDRIRPRATTMHAMVESVALLDMLLR
jgi:DNA mismatch repair ATPase MutS